MERRLFARAASAAAWRAASVAACSASSRRVRVSASFPVRASASRARAASAAANFGTISADSRVAASKAARSRVSDRASTSAWCANVRSTMTPRTASSGGAWDASRVSAG